MSPKVSIIVPNYNHASFLQQRLDSIFKQTYQNFEVILLDDASSDDSLSILEAYKEHPKVSRVIFNKVNTGSPFKQWKKGIEAASGELIWIAESDDYSDLGFLEHMVAQFKDDIGISYAQSCDVDAAGNLMGNRVDYTKEFVPNLWQSDFTCSGLGFIKKYLIVKNVIPNASAVLFKKEVLDETFFETSLLNMRMCGDWFFWIKMCAKTNIRFVNCNLNFIRNHESMTRNHSSNKIKKLRLLEEVSIRNYVFSKHTFKSLKSTKKLYDAWIKNYQGIALFENDFYDVVLNYSSKNALIQTYIKLKLKLLLKQ